MTYPLNTPGDAVGIAAGCGNEYVQPQSPETKLVAVELDDLLEAEARELCSQYGITLEELLEQFFKWIKNIILLLSSTTQSILHFLLVSNPKAIRFFMILLYLENTYCLMVNVHISNFTYKWFICNLFYSILFI